MAYTTEQIAEMVNGAKAEEYGFVEAYDCSLAGYEYPDGLNLEEYCVEDQGADCWIQIALNASNVLSLRHAMHDFLDWARRSGHCVASIETLIRQYEADRLNDGAEHFCPHCNDTGLIWIEGARSMDNPEGDYQTRCVCAESNPQLRNDEVPY